MRARTVEHRPDGGRPPRRRPPHAPQLHDDRRDPAGPRPAPPPSPAPPTRPAAISSPSTRAHRSPSSRATAPASVSSRARPRTTASRPGAPTEGGSCSPASRRAASVDLYVLNVAKGTSRRLTTTGGRAPAWSTRNRIAFVTGYSQVVGQPTRGRLATIKPDGSGRRRAHPQERPGPGLVAARHEDRVRPQGLPVRHEARAAGAFGGCADGSRSRPRMWRGRPTGASWPTTRSSPGSSWSGPTGAASANSSPAW